MKPGESLKNQARPSFLWDLKLRLLLNDFRQDVQGWGGSKQAGPVPRRPEHSTVQGPDPAPAPVPGAWVGHALRAARIPTKTPGAPGRLEGLERMTSAR